MIDTKLFTNRCIRGHYLVIIAAHINNKNRVLYILFQS